MLAVEGLSKSFGGVAAIQDVSLRFAPGSLTAIIGPNGAGKTTFFNLISGAIRPDKGRVTLAGEDIVGLPPAQIARRGVARSFQIASIFPSLSVEAILTATVQAHLRQAERIMRRFPLPECRDRAFAAMDMLGLADKAAVVSANLSHGDQKLLDIGLALVLEPRVLRWMPTRNSMRRSGGRPALRSTMPFCISMAQRTASTTLRNSTRLPSPVRFTMRPLCTAMVGSIRSLRSARSRANVRSSSMPASRL
jgi:ABC-type branched-subunit amino acid transport system ATPase component